MHKDTVANILVYSGGEILGDGILKIPFMAALSRAYPAAKITWLARDDTVYSTLLQSLVAPFIHTVVSNSGVGRSIREIFQKSRFIPSPKLAKFDLIIDTQKSWKRTLILKKIPHKRYISLRTGQGAPPSHFVDQLMYLVEQASGSPVPNGRFFPVTWPFSTEIKRAKTHMAGIKTSVCLIPGAGNKKKVWPLPRYIELAKYLQKQGSTPVFLLGPAEKDWVPVVQKALPKTPILGWKNGKNGLEYTFSVLDVMAISQHFSAIIGNDCGAGHLVATAHKPQITLFGRHTAEKYAPLNPKIIIIDAKDFGGEAMSYIPLSAVITAFDNMMHPPQKTS